MANFLKAHRAFGPQLRLNQPVDLDELVEWMAMRTNLSKGMVMMMLQELNEAILYFNRQGTPVKLPGIGTFSPSIDRNGGYDIHLRLDPQLRRGINAPRAYTGRIHNRMHIGLDDAQYKAIWDQAHPDDPLEL